MLQVFEEVSRGEYQRTAVTTTKGVNTQSCLVQYSPLGQPLILGTNLFKKLRGIDPQWKILVLRTRVDEH
jgi:hypothetical protein